MIMSIKSIVMMGVLSIVTAAYLLAQAPTKPDYALTCSSDIDTSAKCSQARRLLLKQKDAYIAQLRLQEAQTAYNSYMQALAEEGKKIITENGWPANTQFNPNFADPSIAFAAPPPPSVSKEPKR